MARWGHRSFQLAGILLVSEWTLVLTVRFCSSSDSPSDQEVLAELPDQFLRYMRQNGIKPPTQAPSAPPTFASAPPPY